MSMSIHILASNIHIKGPFQFSSLKTARRRALELELRQMELRRTNPAWGQMHESIVDHAAIAERKEERAEAERERAREYRLLLCWIADSRASVIWI